jgi:glycosyltransferase involved in cell wall biosynthesis
MGALPSREQREEISRLGKVELFESSYQLEWTNDPWADVARAGDWLLQLEEDLHPDVVHLNGYVHAALLWRAPKIVVGHSCVLSWWKAVRKEEAPGEWGKYRELVSRGLQAADLVIAPSHAMLDELEVHYGPLASRKVIPNGRNPASFQPGEKQPFILAAGRLWDEGKNMKLLASVAPRVDRPVYLAGENQHPDGGTAQPQNARLLGRLAPGQLAGWYSKASIYCLPARYEPFGLSALEAGLAGCALVLGDIPSLREIWQDAATFVSPEDPDALCSALRRLAADPVRCKESGEKARRRALTFTTDRMVTGYLAAYSEVRRPKAPAAADPKAVFA